MKLLRKKSEFWNRDIRTSDEVDSFLKKYWDNSTIIDKDRERWTPPIFLYHEQRGEDNYVNASALYGGGVSRTIVFGLIEPREILAINGSQSLIDSNFGGEVLSAFSKIEFVLDILVCIEVGVYENYQILQSIEKELDNDGLFSTTYKKLRYLKLKNVIDNETYKWIDRARQVRNNLAHSYLPFGNYGVEESLLKQFDNYQGAIDYIFNVSWFYILNTYAPLQVKVLKWLNHEGEKGAK